MSTTPQRRCRRLRAAADRRARRAPHRPPRCSIRSVREALAQVGCRARRHRLPGVGLRRLHRRPAVRLRRRARRDGLLAAAAGPPPRDGRLVRRLLRVGARSRPARSTPRIVVRPRQDVGGRARARLQPAARSVLPGGARARPHVDVGAAGERLHGAHRRDRSPISRPIAARNRAAGARNPDAQVREAATAADTAADAVGRRAAAPAATCRRSARAPRASCWPPRARPRSSASARCGSTASTIAPSCSRSARAT